MPQSLYWPAFLIWSFAKRSIITTPPTKPIKNVIPLFIALVYKGQYKKILEFSGIGHMGNDAHH